MLPGSGFALWYMLGMRALDRLTTPSARTRAALRRREQERLSDGHPEKYSTTAHSATSLDRDCLLTIEVPAGKSCRVVHDGITVTVRSK